MHSVACIASLTTTTRPTRATKKKQDQQPQHRRVKNYESFRIKSFLSISDLCINTDTSFRWVFICIFRLMKARTVKSHEMLRRLGSTKRLHDEKICPANLETLSILHPLRRCESITHKFFVSEIFVD